MKKLLLIFVLVVVAIGATYPRWKPIAKRNKWFVIASNVGLDSMRRYGIRRGQIGQEAAPQPSEERIAGDVARIRNIYRQYLRYSGVGRESIPGKRVIELGPGSNIGVPLLFAADGAGRVAGLDKFVPFQDGPYAKMLYSGLRETLDPPQQARFDGAIALDPAVVLRRPAADYIYGKDLAECVSELGPGSYDLIVSNAVIEEIYDPDAVFAAQDRLLRPGGVMVHKIDLRDYGMFSKYGFHPLEFLTVPDWVYRRMVEASGQPNRRLVDYYRSAAARMGYRAEIYTTQLLGVPGELPEPELDVLTAEYPSAGLKLVRDIRPRLLPRYRRLPDSDLMAQGIIFVAHKPPRESAKRAF